MSIKNPAYIKMPTDQSQVANGTFPYGGAAPAGAFSETVHDNLVRNTGFPVIHYRYAFSSDRAAVEGGTGLKSATAKDSFDYYDPRKVFITVQNFSWSDTYMMQGIYNSHEIGSVNFTSVYEETGERVFLRENDVLVAEPDITVLTQQRIEYNGRDCLKLAFPVFSVDYLKGSSGTRFYENTDFQICNGSIEWLAGGAKPFFTNGRGEALSAVYWTKPYYQVIATPRPFRIAYTNKDGNPNLPRNLTYLPGSAVVRMLWSSVEALDLPDWSMNDIPAQGGNIK